MKRFIKNILLFFLPVIMFCCAMLPFYFAAVNCGEFKDIEENIEAQRKNHDILIGLGYNEQTAYYKLVNANHYQADVIALGTSRVMLIKKDYFRSSFYNCGGAVGGNYREYVNFLENLNYKPKIIILGLDQWVFNDAWNKQCKDYTFFKIINKDKRNFASMLKEIVKDWKKKRWKFSDMDLYPQNIGFNGRIKNSGYMYDGSYYYGDVYRSPKSQTDYQFKDTFSRIAKGIHRFEWGEHIDLDTLAQLKTLLEYCIKNKIQVVGFFPPFAPSVYNRMQQSGNYGYLKEINPACRDIFNKYGFELYDYTDGIILKVTDGYFIDGFHGSEVAYGYILKSMVAEGSSIKHNVDWEILDKISNTAFSKITFNKVD